MAMNYEQHVQQNNERLICIKQALREPNSFASAAKELLEWCLDPRAFQKPFEDNIIACLNIVTNVARRDGYDLNLGCRLLSICANYREKFSPDYAVLLEQWNEELSQAVLLRHQPDPLTMDSNKMQKQSSMIDANHQDMMWSNGTGGSVSVVTTVYSGVSSFNAPVAHNYNVANVGAMYNGSAAYMRNGQNAMQKQASYPVENGSYGGYARDYHQVANSDYNRGAPQHAALNAAHVAAAAVATATATATAVALDHSQFQPYNGGQQNSGYNSQYATPVEVVHNQYSTSSRMMAPNVNGGPHMPPNYMPQGARSRGGCVRYPASVPKMMPPNAVVGPSQYAASQMMPRSAPGGYPGQSIMHHPSGPSNSQYQRYPNSVRGGPQYGMMQNNVQYMNDGYHQSGMPNSMSAGHQVSGYQPRLYGNSSYGSVSGVCSGNPTPPMTPNGLNNVASPLRYNSVPPTPSVDVKPIVNCQDSAEDDDRLAVPVPNGVIMKPFHLEHNAPVSQHPFCLSEESYQMLCYTDHDLQLKCFHQQDSIQCHWPANANVQVCINGTPVLLHNPNKPLYIKSLCVPNENVLQISVQQCSCSHLFVLTLVDRPKISVLKEILLQKRLLSAEQAKEKIRRYFQSIREAAIADGIKTDGEQMPLTLPLRCPMSRSPIRLPARGQHCQHIQCFDLDTFLTQNRDRLNWLCPICREEVYRDTLEIDEFIYNAILTEPFSEEITVDSNACLIKSTRPVNHNNNVVIKQEDIGSVPKRFKPDPDQVNQSGNFQCRPNLYTSALSLPGSAYGPTSSCSPSYCQTISPSPVPPNPQRQRTNLSGNQMQSPSPVSGAYVSNTRPTRQSADSALCPQFGVNQKANRSNAAMTAVGQPRSVGNPRANAEGNLSLTINGADGSVTGSAPYTPASVSSAGSHNSGPGSIIANVDSYGNDLYSDLDFLLNDSTTTNSMSLLGDCMDELDMLKYLDNTDGDIGSASSTSAGPVDSSRRQPSQQVPPPRSVNNNNVSTNPSRGFVSSNELSALDDVLTNYLT